MRKRTTLATLLVVALALPGCLTKKTNEAQPDATADLQRGTWSWQQSTGGIAGGTSTPASTGRQQAISFDHGTARFYTNGQLVRTATYTIQPGSCIHTGQSADLISYDSGLKQHFIVSGDKLQLADEVYDGFGHVYRRQ